MCRNTWRCQEILVTVSGAQEQRLNMRDFLRGKEPVIVRSDVCSVLHKFTYVFCHGKTVHHAGRMGRSLDYWGVAWTHGA